MEPHLAQSSVPVEGEAAGDILETPFAQDMFMNGFNSEPFVNEVCRIQHVMNSLELKNGNKKMQVCSQYEQDIENTRKKYDLLLKVEDVNFESEKALLQELRQKVTSGKSVDKELRAYFVEQRGGMDASHQGLVPGQLGNSILGQAPPIYQVETFRVSSVLGPAAGRNLSSAIAQPTGT